MLYLKEPSPILGVHVKLVQIERVLGNGRTLGDRSPALLHEGEQLVQPGLPVGVIVDLVKPLEVLDLGLLHIANIRLQQRHRDSQTQVTIELDQNSVCNVT